MISRAYIYERKQSFVESFQKYLIMNYVKTLPFPFFCSGENQPLDRFYHLQKEDVSFVNKVAVNKTCKMVRNKQAFGNHKPPLCNMHPTRLLGSRWYH